MRGLRLTHVFQPAHKVPALLHGSIAARDAILNVQALLLDTDTTSLIYGVGAPTCMIGAPDWVDHQLRVCQLITTSAEPAMLKAFRSCLRLDPCWIRMGTPLHGIDRLDLPYPNPPTLQGTLG